ncbi:MAG: hypothetical protein HYU99_06170 [Deltaproteobacteria bacterium]|nr:hypothetical protein [Deltaproteobacteria bacterium]
MPIWSDFKNSPQRSDGDRALLDALIDRAGVDPDTWSAEGALNEVPYLLGFVDPSDAESAGRTIELLDAASGDFYAAIPSPSAPASSTGPSRRLLDLWAVYRSKTSADDNREPRIAAEPGRASVLAMKRSDTTNIFRNVLAPLRRVMKGEFKKVIGD